MERFGVELHACQAVRSEPEGRSGEVDGVFKIPVLDLEMAVGTYHHRKAVVDPERIQPLDPPWPIAVADALERSLCVLDGRLLQHGRERGPCVFGIQVDGTAFQCFVSQQRTSEVEFPVHFDAETPLDMARHDLPEQHLFREILRPDHHARPGRTSGRQRGNQDEYRRSIHPSASSAAIAINAAGTAPARIVFVSAIAMPRKTKVPNPPPPMAAAMVAVPIVVTVAMRIPARMVGNASGSSTPHRIWRAVIPMATADSRTPEIGRASCRERV